MMEKDNDEKIVSPSGHSNKINVESSVKIKLLDQLFTQMRNCSDDAEKNTKDNENAHHPTKVQVRKSIKSLFNPTLRFHRHLKRGVYFACTLYNVDKILITNEEILPVVEVDDTLPATFQIDFHWIMKVACSWSDVKLLRKDIEKTLNSPSLHFRNKFLEAATQMQILLGIEDLGTLYYHPIKDESGNVVVCTVKQINDLKSFSAPSTKWISMEKLEKNKNNQQEVLGEMLISSISEQINYSQMKEVTLPRGLYLGYLKLISTLDSIHLIVPTQLPNIFPQCLIRENANVTCEEIEWIKNLSSNVNHLLSSTLLQFGLDLNAAVEKLLNELGISQTEAQNYRFCGDVIWLNADVSFILMLPEIENMCSLTTKEAVTKLELTLLPVQIFEIVHMLAYQKDFITQYCRLSLLLEMDKILAHRSLREAFSTSEISSCKQKVNQLHEFQVQVDNVWKSVRWILQIITWARDKHSTNRVRVKELCTWHKKLKFKPPPIRDKVQSLAESLKTEDNPKASVTQQLLVPQPNTSSGDVIRVFAAYQTGLTSGTSVKLHITTKTTAKEVVNLVVRQLNVAASCKGTLENVESDEKNQVLNFCLVAVLGARERRLRDDFCPLQLQNPWAKGRLYVRRKKDLLAAIHHHNAIAKDFV